MKRSLFTILSALSLLLCVATMVLWARSHFVSDSLRSWRVSRIDLLLSERGHLIWYRMRIFNIHGESPESGYSFDSSPPRSTTLSMLPEDAFRDTPGWVPVSRRTDLMMDLYGVKYWAICLATAVMPALWTLTRPRKRSDPGLRPCPSCGYDLRATPERCPECGHVPTPEPATAR